MCIRDSFGALGRISGYNVSDIETMIVIGQNSRLQIGGVLFSGILIASLGAVMDVAMSISSTASELIAQTPSLTPVSYTHLDVYKSQAGGGGGQHDRPGAPKR